MRPVVFTVVHPESYFFSWESKDDSWYEQEYGDVLVRLKLFIDRAVTCESPLICIRQLLLEEDSMFSLNFLHALTNHNLEASGLASLIACENKNSSFREYLTLNGGVPLADEAKALDGMASIIKHYPQLLFQHSYREAFVPYENAVHLLAGGVFSRCVVNWGNVLKKTFPEIDLCYIDELCIDGNAEGRTQALELISQTGGRLISYDEALTLL
ncbi:MAG: hypothetical protein QT08_C0013G0011 [archaeon GW2011_AR17]|nr:MAG: hypothetical protein QT08_C0013G0011 [archaeon GW2011_AR17]MBS3153854.1 hypothetical protein [Candidatus Woesearchaeota archaeon]HIH15455.1 hypothetical protein [Nanoarchaeota archaeon]HIH59258.1 hypothetical protein [Nanoarchaeota archaeon]HII13947.1 hypothetical protein [Nanoarchaeota archaeon]